jgi:hypothetical protein
MTLITTIVLTSLLICCIVAVLVYYSTAPFVIKLTALPVVLVLCTSLVLTTIERMGAPIKDFPEGEFDYVHHITAQQGEVILLWATTEEKGTRLYMFNYTRETQKELDKAKQEQSQGNPQVGEFTDDPAGGGDPIDPGLKVVDKDTINLKPEDFVKE